MIRSAPLVLAFVDNDLLSAEIRDATSAPGFALEVVSSAEIFGAAGKREALGEPLHSGQTSRLTQHLTVKQPGLLLFDLDNSAIPWHRWLPVIKTSPATRRIPALVFGSASQAEQFPIAESRGADIVLKAAQFQAQIARLIKKHTKQYDFVAIENACSVPLSKLGLDGIELFNKGEFFDAHEELEHAWNEDKSAGRDFYRAVLQVAVAYLQIERGNYRGAIKMFLRVRQWLNQLPNECHGVDLAQLRKDAEAAHSQVVALGPDRISEFDFSTIGPVLMAP